MFLTRMGMHIRIEALKQATKTSERKASIEKAARRLVDTLGMGKEYQVLGIARHERSGHDPGVEDVWPFMDIKEGSGSG